MQLQEGRDGHHSEQVMDSQPKSTDVEEELVPNASSETALHERKDGKDGENAMYLDETSASEGVTNTVHQKEGQCSIIRDSNELGSQWVDGRQ
jgi:hypothetical protein